MFGSQDKSHNMIYLVFAKDRIKSDIMEYSLNKYTPWGGGIKIDRISYICGVRAIFFQITNLLN